MVLVVGEVYHCIAAVKRDVKQRSGNTLRMSDCLQMSGSEVPNLRNTHTTPKVKFQVSATGLKGCRIKVNYKYSFAGIWPH